MYNCPVRWCTVVDEISVDEMSVDELSWNPCAVMGHNCACTMQSRPTAEEIVNRLSYLSPTPLV